MKLLIDSKCICGSDKKYKKCCKRFHDGKVPKTAVALVRSRFSAYALYNIDYIINTTHFESPDFTENKQSWKNDIHNFCEYTDFKGLEILDFEEGEIQSFVTFKAILLQNNLDASFAEKSRFLKNHGRWYYMDGIFL